MIELIFILIACFGVLLGLHPKLPVQIWTTVAAMMLNLLFGTAALSPGGSPPDQMGAVLGWFVLILVPCVLLTLSMWVTVGVRAVYTHFKKTA